MAGNIYLLGFMAAGKTTVGRLLSEELGWSFVDLDAVIEQRAGMTIAEIFSEYGEAHFRGLEKQALREISEAASRAVVALGGGTYADSENRRIAHESGTCVFLDAPLDQILSRIEDHETRPLARRREDLAALYEKRLPAYRESDLHVGAHGDPSDVAAGIIEKLVALEKLR